MSKVNLLIIATNKYNNFVMPLLESVEQYFLKGHDIVVHLFSDQVKWHQVFTKPDFKVIQHQVPSYGFPEATLLRYRIFSNHAQAIDGDYVFYLDVDSLVVAPVGDEILFDGLIVTQHPGFYINHGWGSSGVIKESKAYVDPKNRSMYVCGGFNGGKREWYMQMASILADNIDEDEKNNARAEWHDESALNWYVNEYHMWNTTGGIRPLDPSYMMVENIRQRQLWGISHLSPKIIARDKKHKELRS